jgi:hypothetical protein
MCVTERRAELRRVSYNSLYAVTFREQQFNNWIRLRRNSRLKMPPNSLPVAEEIRCRKRWQSCSSLAPRTFFYLIDERFFDSYKAELGVL